MSGLQNLKEITKNLSVLYVEDSPVLMEKMTVFLGKIFKEVYQAYNGQEGYKNFITYKPDVIITDLSMPIMTGHEMIAKIKQKDPMASIIVYSAYADRENLLESIHLGVVDFIPKPVDIKLFEQVLTKVIKQKEQTIQPSQADEEKIYKVTSINLMKKLELIQKGHKSLEFINHYRGVPIFDKGSISSIDNETITIEVPYLQALAIKNEKKTVINSELLEHTVEAHLIKLHSHNNKITLGDLQYLESENQQWKQTSVEPDDAFSCQVSYQGDTFTNQVNLLSNDYIILTIKTHNTSVDIVEGAELDLIFNIKEKLDTHIPKVTTLKTKGEVYFIEEAFDHKKTMLLFELDFHKKELLDDYIINRRKELITEFKKMKD